MMPIIKNVAFSDDISEASQLIEQDEEEELDLENHVLNKPSTAPQIQRTPVFAYKTEEKKPSKYSNPSRPSTSNNKAPSTSRPNSRKNNINLENRILIKLASVLPGNDAEQEKAAHGRLPESRNTLMKLNAELDEMAKEIRELNTEHGHYLMANFLDLSNNNFPQINLETGQPLFDVVIAELANQAFKKIIRINKFYRHHLVLQRNQHHAEITEYKSEIEQLRSQLHHQQLVGLLPTTADGSNPAESPPPFIQLPLDKTRPQPRASSRERENRRGSSPDKSPKSSPSPKGRNSVAFGFHPNNRVSILSPGRNNNSNQLSEKEIENNKNFAMNYEDFLREHTSYVLGENSKKLELLHTFVAKTLEHERKVRELLFH